MEEIKKEKYLMDEIRPRIANTERVKKLAEKYKTTPTSIVNLLVDIGSEVLDRAGDEIINKYQNKLRDLLK